MAAGGRGGERREFGISRGELLQTGWISKKDLLCSPGNYIQHAVTRMEKNMKKCVCVCVCVCD